MEGQHARRRQQTLRREDKEIKLNTWQMQQRSHLVIVNQHQGAIRPQVHILPMTVTL